MPVKYDLCRAYLPYCMEQQEDGSYMILNRGYLPLGWPVRTWPANMPIAVHIEGLTPAIAKKISVHGRSETDHICFYDDIPTDDPSEWSAYGKRLAILAKLKLSPAQTEYPAYEDYPPPFMLIEGDEAEDILAVPSGGSDE